MKRVESFISLRTRQKRLWKISKFLFITFLIWEFFSIFILKTYTARSSAMSPTIRPGDRILVLPSSYGLPSPYTGKNIAKYSKPSRGDIVMLYQPFSDIPSWPNRALDEIVKFLTLQQLGVPSSNSFALKPVIKRIVAEPGDTVRIENFIAYIKPTGLQHFLTEFEVSGRVYDTQSVGIPDDWVKDLPFSGNMEPITLGENQYFVMGDNRVAANDSRFFGVVSGDMILSRVIARYWPFRKPAFF